MSVLLAGGIAAGSALLGQAFNAYQSGKMNKRAERFNREMYAKQRADNLSDWHMQNAYNDPAAQMQRLQNANLNPHLVYGNGADAQMASPVRSSNISNPSYDTPRIDLGSVVAQALQAKQIQSNIANTDAQTDALKQKTAIGQFELAARQEIGQSEFTKQLLAKTQSMTAQDTQKVREFQQWLDVAFSTSDSLDVTVDKLGMFPTHGSKFVSDSITATTKRAIMEIENIKSGIALRNQQVGLNELEMVLKKAEADFTKALGSKTGASFALQLLRTVLGK